MAFQVLCVDDNSYVLTVLRWALESCGYGVTTAQSGAEAIARLAEPFDAAVLDFDLPDTDGVLLAQRVKCMQPEVPLILFSGCADLPHSVLHNFCAVVSKGSELNPLLATLARLAAGDTPAQKTEPQPR